MPYPKTCVPPRPRPTLRTPDGPMKFGCLIVLLERTIQRLFTLFGTITGRRNPSRLNPTTDESTSLPLVRRHFDCALDFLSCSGTIDGVVIASERSTGESTDVKAIANPSAQPDSVLRVSACFCFMML